MKLPNYHRAVIDIRKLSKYCLNPAHPVGKHKASVFKAGLGVTQKDAESLKGQILDGLANSDAKISNEDRFGIRYSVQMDIHNGDKIAPVVTVWVIRKDYNVPELVICYLMT